MLKVAARVTQDGDVGRDAYMRRIRKSTAATKEEVQFSITIGTPSAKHKMCATFQSMYVIVPNRIGTTGVSLG
jgi:hypothetical protein